MKPLEGTDSRFTALDEIKKARVKIYDAKRTGAVTPKDNVVLKDLHARWLEVMQDINDPNHAEAVYPSKQKNPRLKKLSRTVLAFRRLYHVRKDSCGWSLRAIATAGLTPKAPAKSL
jgi:hypothetical protein